MFRNTFNKKIIAALVITLFLTPLVMAQDHPRFYFSQDEISDLRAKANGPLTAVRDQILAHANSHLGNPPSPTRNMYSLRSYGTYLVSFAFSYVLTGDQKYLNTARNWMIEFAGWDYWDSSPDTRGLALSDMLIGHSLAYDWLYNDLSPSDRATIRDSITRKARMQHEAGTATYYNNDWANWWGNSYIQNHTLIDWSAVGLAGLVLKGEVAEANSYISAAKYAFGNIRTVMNRMKDSHWHESTQYGAYAFTKSLIFLVNLRKVEGTDLIPHNFYRNYSIWRSYNYIPNSLNLAVPTGDFEWNWNDPSSPHILRFCAKEYKDGRAQWLADFINNQLPRSKNTYAGPEAVLEFLNYNTSISSVSPNSLPTFARFDDLEGVVWRSGWSESDFIFSFKTGAYGGRSAYETWLAYSDPWNSKPSQGVSPRLNAGHDHDDQHSFFIHFNGTWVAPEHTEYGKDQAVFHNSILIDGYGQFAPQDQNWNDYPKNGARSDGKLERTIDYKNYHYLIADGTNAYANFTDIKKVRRYILYIKPQTILMVDELGTGNARTFDWICHFASTPSREGGWVKAPAGSNIMGVKLLTTSGHETYFGNDGSPYMRTKNSSPKTDTVMAHLLHASKGGAWGSRPDAELLADDGSAIVMRVTFSDGSRSDVFINYAGTTSFKTVGGLRTDAELAVVERFSSGKVKKILLYGGTAIYENSGAQLLADGLERGNAYDIDQTNQNALKIEFGLVR